MMSNAYERILRRLTQTLSNSSGGVITTYDFEEAFIEEDMCPDCHGEIMYDHEVGGMPDEQIIVDIKCPECGWKADM